MKKEMLNQTIQNLTKELEIQKKIQEIEREVQDQKIQHLQDQNKHLTKQTQNQKALNQNQSMENFILQTRNKAHEKHSKKSFQRIQDLEKLVEEYKACGIFCLVQKEISSHVTHLLEMWKTVPEWSIHVSLLTLLLPVAFYNLFIWLLSTSFWIVIFRSMRFLYTH